MSSVAAAHTGAAQVATNRNARYLFIADPGDARAIWTNPGALGLAGTLSVYADATVGFHASQPPGSALSQISVGFSSHFLAASYQFDRLPDAAGGVVRGHAYRFVLWGSDGRFGVGGAATLYRGGDGGQGFDVGAAYRLNPWMDLGAVVANLGEPSVRGAELTSVFRPAVTFHTRDHALGLQAQGAFGDAASSGFSVGARLLARTPVTLQAIARLDTDRDLRRRTFVFGLSIGGENRVVGVFTTSGDLRTSEAFSLHGVSERPRGRRR